MLKKILLIIGAILILVITVEAGIYFSTKGFPTVSRSTSQPSPAPASKGPAVLLATNTYLVTGNVTTTFKINEDGNLSGNFVLLGDPKKTIHKLIILVVDDKVTSIKNSVSNSLIKDRQQLSTKDIITKAIPYHKIRIRIDFITSRPLKQNEILTRQVLDRLIQGNWDIPDIPAFASDNLELLD